MKTARNLTIALAVGGGLFIALALAEASTPGLDFGATKWFLPVVLGGGLFRGLSALSGNRRVQVVDTARKAELLGFPPRAGCGWVVVTLDFGSRRGAVGFDVRVDGKVVAQLLPKRFTMLALPVGPHRLLVDLAVAAGAEATPLDVDVMEGKVMILAIRSKMGIVRTSVRLDPVADTPAARAALARLQLVEPEVSPA